MPFSPCRHFLPPNLVGFYINHLHQEQGTGGRQNNTETKHPLWLPNLLCRLWVSFRMNLVLTTFFWGGDGRGSTIASWFRIQIATGFNGFCLGFCMFLPKASSTKLPPKVAKVGTFFQSSFRFLPGAPRGRETGETDSSVLGLRNLKTWRTEKHHFGVRVYHDFWIRENCTKSCRFYCVSNLVFFGDRLVRRVPFWRIVYEGMTQSNGQLAV